jgi:drug/metabolite transporter (DMT)-like permease
LRRAPAAALVAAALVFAAMALATKVAAARLPGPQIAFVRFLIGIAACGVARTRIRMRANNKLGLLLRGAYGGAAVLFFFIGIAHLPVGIATLLNYTAPVFTAIYAAAFLGETISRATLGALALTSIGVVLVILGTAPAGSLSLDRWELAGVLSAILSGAAVATIREVRKTDGSWEIFAAFCAAGAVICAVPAARGWL